MDEMSQLQVSSSEEYYYVDGNEKPATVEYHKRFIHRYLTYDLLGHR